MFTLYYLAIKIGLIGPNLAPKLNQDQPTQQLVSRVAYNRYVSVLDDYRRPGLYMDKIEQPVPQHYVSNHSESVIKELRAGSLLTDAAWLLITIWMLHQQSVGFQPVRPVARPPHVEAAQNLLFAKPKSDGHLSNSNKISTAGPRSLTVRGLTKNVGYEKKDPLDYKEIMRELDRQSSRKIVEIEAGDQIYTIKNPYRENTYELGDKLADQIYDSIRESDTDICDIAENLGFKANNIKIVKDHIFHNEHDLDRYGPDQIERKQFDPNLQQGLAWKRLETGTHTQDDVTWIKHECAERHHEFKYASGYNEAHNRAQTRFDGAPWEDQF